MTDVNSPQSLSSPSPITVTSTNTSSVGTHIHSPARTSTVNSYTGLIASTTERGNYTILRNIRYYTNNSIIIYY